MARIEQGVAVITGGASGIGRSLARVLAQRGVNVAVADVDMKQAEAAVKELGSNARAFRCDVTERSQLQDFSKAVTAEWGSVNYVFANAGVAIAGDILSTEVREFDWLFDVNVRGVFSTMQIFVPLLIQAASTGSAAHFVVTGSENSLGVPPAGATSVYTATKHAVLALADTLRRDLVGTGVGVSIFCPGVVDTQLFDARRTRQDRYGGHAAIPPEFVERASKAVAQGQKPDMTAALCLDGVSRGDFMIITDPKIRSFVTKRHREIEAALDRVDTTLAARENA